MKKSQLRNIIRESIKGLMNEQGSVWYCMGPTGNQQCIENPPSVPQGGTPFNTLADCQSNCSIVQDPACQAVLGAVHPGPPPVVSQTFINNMQNKTCNFYNNRFTKLTNKKLNLMTVLPGGSAQPCLIGDNPTWQVQITHKIKYIQQNFGPGTTMNCTSPPR